MVMFHFTLFKTPIKPQFRGKLSTKSVLGVVFHFALFYIIQC